jgi:hypothetical protein
VAGSESFFKTISSQLLSYFMGQMGSNFHDRTEFETREYASVTYEDLVRPMIHWIVDDYHCDGHSGLGMSPLKAWLLLSRIAPPYIPHGPEKLTEIFCEAEVCPLGANGITIANSQFQSNALQQFRRALGDGAKSRSRSTAAIWANSRPH